MVVDQGLADEPVWSIFEDAEADIWVGTESGLRRLSPITICAESSRSRAPDTGSNRRRPTKSTAS